MTSIEATIRLITNGKNAGSTCSEKLADDPWEIDLSPGYGPGASESDLISPSAPRQGLLPAEYKKASDEELDRRADADGCAGKRGCGRKGRR